MRQSLQVLLDYSQVFRLGEAILQTLFEAGESNGAAGKDPIFVMQSRYPGTAARDIASELTVLAAQGFIRLTAKNGAAITAAGLRKIQDFQGIQTDRLSPIDVFHSGENSQPHAAPTRVEDENSELELDDIIDLIAPEKPDPDLRATTSPAPEHKVQEYLPPTLEEEDLEPMPLPKPVLSPLPEPPGRLPSNVHPITANPPSQMINLRGEIQRLQREIAKLESVKPTHYLRLVNITRDLEQATNRLDAFILDLIPPKN